MRKMVEEVRDAGAAADAAARERDAARRERARDGFGARAVLASARGERCVGVRISARCASR